MYIKDIIKVTDGKLSNLVKMNKKINKIRLDSRCIENDDVFICIGKGIDYIEEAINKGCILIISDQDIKIKTNIGILKVDNIHDTLLKLIGFIRNKYINIPLVAITGSVGKSTTKELISDIISTEYNVLKNDGNKNNYIGIADTIFNLDNSFDVIVLEMGMNHFHELEELSLVTKPDICVITGIGTSHIGNLGSKKGIFKAKLEITKGMENGYLVVPPNDYYLTKLHGDNIIKCYDINIKNIKIKDNLKFLLRYNNNEYDIIFNIPNKYYINNIIVSFKVATLFNIDIKNIINKINNFKPISNRMNIINYNNFTIIDDTYNSSYESVKGDLEFIRKYKNKKIIILGDIKELGIYSKKIHIKINKLLNKINNKEVLLVGEYVKYINGLCFNDNLELINYLDNIDLTDTIILLKGSRLMKLEEIRDYILENKRI